MARQQTDEDRREKALHAGALNRANDRSFLETWRARGGYEGALVRSGAAETLAYSPGATLPAKGYMPFPGHRHCGLWIWKPKGEFDARP